MLELAGAPRARTRSKVRGTDEDIARAIVFAGDIWRQSWPIPLVVDAKTVGLLGYSAKRDESYLVPVGRVAASSIYDSYNEGVAERLATGGNYAIHWHKLSSNRTVAFWYDTFSAIGNPQAGSWGGTARTARQFSSSTVGAMAYPAASPAKRFMSRQSHFQQSVMNVSIPQDRVLSYEGCTMSTSSQAMTNTLTAQRRITSAPGLKISSWIDTTQNATAANLTAVSYTNPGGTSGQLVKTTPVLARPNSTATVALSGGARSTFKPDTTTARPYLELADGDIGCKQIDSYQWSAAPTGTNAFVLSWPYHLQIDSFSGNASTLQGMSVDEDLMSGFPAEMDLQLLDTACLNVLVYTRANIGGCDYGYFGSSVNA